MVILIHLKVMNQPIAGCCPRKMMIHVVAVVVPKAAVVATAACLAAQQQLTEATTNMTEGEGLKGLHHDHFAPPPLVHVYSSVEQAH